MELPIGTQVVISGSLVEGFRRRNQPVLTTVPGIVVGECGESFWVTFNYDSEEDYCGIFGREHLTLMTEESKVSDAQLTERIRGVIHQRMTALAAELFNLSSTIDQENGEGDIYSEEGTTAHSGFWYQAEMIAKEEVAACFKK